MRAGADLQLLCPFPPTSVPERTICIARSISAARPGCATVRRVQIALPSFRREGRHPPARLGCSL